MLRFIGSEKYRVYCTRTYLKHRVQQWRKRKQFTEREARDLSGKIDAEETSRYLTDFFAHVALKPFETILSTAVVPALYFHGQIGITAAIFLVIWGGSITRSTYTLVRMIATVLRVEINGNLWRSLHAFGSRVFVERKGHHYFSPEVFLRELLEFPRVLALCIGVLPTVGNLAYPVQMFYATSTRDRHLGKFLLYDLFSRIGRKVPIWGGPDTLTEHLCNHFPDRIIKKRS